MAEKIIIIDKQNLLDVVLQATGSIESLFEVALRNGVSITEELTPGVSISFDKDKGNKDVLAYYVRNNITPATGSTADNIGIEVQEGIGFWGIEIDFVVS